MAYNWGMMDIVKTITGYLGKRAFKKLDRNHKVLKIKQKLAIDELKTDPQSVYAHALVEYAADAVPVELVTLFAVKEVKEAFQTGLHKNRQTEFDGIIKTQFDENRKLAFLKNIYAAAADLQPEIERFRELYDYFALQTADAYQLKKYNEDKAFQLEILEEKQRKSFDFQADRYLEKLKDSFHKDFLKDGLYIDLNAETRIEKQGPGALKEREKGKQREEEEPAYDYEKIPHRPIDTYINQWLANEGRNFLVIIGEYGTGKTTFLRHMAHQLASSRLEPGSETAISDPAARLPLFFPLRDFEKRMETYIVSRLNEEGITDIDFARFKARLKNNECILLLDGFDEMTQKIDADEKTANFAKIRALIETGEKSKIILTTRQEYFQSARELERVFKHTDKKDYHFIHLLPFDDGQIQEYLKTHTDKPDFYWEQIEEIFDLHDLAKRPVLLELIVEHLPGLIKEKGEKETIHASNLYERCIHDELDRKRNELRFIVPPEHRLKILQNLAVWLFSNDASLSFDTGMLESELNLRQYFKTERAWEFEKYLSEFLTFTFLIRESDHRYRMSHKSFRDYLTAQAFVREINKGKIEHFAKNRLTDEVIHFMREQGPDEKKLLKLVLTARDLSEETQWQGTNAANLLLKMDDTILKGKDLSRCQLSYVDFSGCDLTGANLKEANLSNCSFYGKSILSAQLGDTNFENSSLDLFNKKITDITALKDMRGLTVLYLDSTQISDLSPIQGLTQLNYLNLNSTQISDLSPIQGLTQLTRLDLDSTQISDLSPIQGLTQLQTLDLRSTQISDLSPIQGLTQLYYLDLRSTQISDLSPIQGLTQLQTLVFRSTQISDLSPIQGLKNLRWLYLSKNQVPETQIKAVKEAIPGITIDER
jgi:uncharacterized protein YjbI with pentapeptide repeats